MSQLLEPLKQRIETALSEQLPKTSDIAQSMVNAMRYAVLGGGKRMRPIMVCAACDAFGGDMENALPVACAIEFIHSYSLIHDDLPAMDDDAIRHAQPSTHIAFGEATAILAGDSLHSLAFESITKAPNLDPVSRLKIVELLSRAAGWPGMAGSQSLDIEAEGQTLTLQKLESLHRAKTGALIQVALESGMLCADPEPDPERFALVGQFGAAVGLAFQVVDDILDVTGSTLSLGKPAGSDAEHAKNTFPKLLGLEAAHEHANKLLTQALSLLDAAACRTPLLELIANKAVIRTF